MDLDPKTFKEKLRDDCAAGRIEDPYTLYAELSNSLELVSEHEWTQAFADALDMLRDYIVFSRMDENGWTYSMIDNHPNWKHK